MNVSVFISAKNQSNCFSNFSSWAQLRRHLNKRHLGPAASVTTSELKSSSDSQCVRDVQDNTHTDDESVDENMDRGQSPSEFKTSLQQFILQFVGKLYADPALPRSHVQTTVDMTKSLLINISSVLAVSVVSALEAQKADKGVIDGVTSILGVLETCMDECSSEHRRLKILLCGGLLYPKAYDIGHSMVDRKRGSVMVKDIVPMTGQFIPLRKLFQMFFSLPGVYNTCKSYMDALEEETGVLSNFVQGKLWREKKKFFRDKIVFPLFVYYDDLEVNNPLGSHKGLSTVGATYVTIPCLPPEFRSTLDNIFLAVLVHSLDRTTYGNAAVFNILVNEINYLQRNGITLNRSGQSVQVYFALGLILGDNLGLNGILGYVESFRANYFCRFCKTHRDLTQTNCLEITENLRTIYNYEEDVRAPVEESGIKEHSVWNNVEYFHVYQNYCSDPLLHELAEGAGKRAMRRIVDYYVNNSKSFTLQHLNQRLKTFPYKDCGISNKPPLISETELAEKKKIHMSGVVK